MLVMKDRGNGEAVCREGRKEGSLPQQKRVYITERHIKHERDGGRVTTMVAKEKRRSWYPILAKRRKMKMTAEATKIPLHRTDICTDTKRAEVAERIIRKRKNSRSSPLSVARKKNIDTARTDDDAHGTATHDRKLCKVASSTPPAGLFLHATEYCPPWPARWYHLGLPLLATRVRELLFGRPLMISHPTAALTGVSLSDEEALSWLFPAVHNGEWFTTPWEFIDHCRSISHKLLCENAPLIPLVAFRIRGKCSPLPPADGKTERAVVAVMDHLGESEKGEGGNGGAVSMCTDSVRDVYYLWFMYIHISLVKFGEQDWVVFLKWKGKVVKATDQECVGRVWSCYRVFQTNVANAVARQLASSSQLVWQSLPETALAMACTVLDVYLRLLLDTAPLQGLRDGLTQEASTRASYNHLEHLVWMNDDPTTDAHAAAGMALAKDGASLTAPEKEAIISLSVYLAKIITDMRHADGDVFPRATDNVNSMILEPPLLSSLGDPAAEIPFPHLIWPVDENEEEEKIMALVLWLYLSDAAEHTDTQTDTYRERESASDAEV
ncbi:hypothetical protein C4B63_54g48 [Trypanosoma cruzi]|uniref:Uncharacterized protein n=1 Tax=Trypanosoma cruzi TaxID=5693 RepID=A0A2V2V3B7_TRYCR|nr:hypothetical protein C4B63_54g48 [Trypanosoma cruzi]